MEVLTPVLEYWKFTKAPFEDYTLLQDSLHLFVNRNAELKSLHNSITNRLTGVLGAQGVGKSSLLRKFFYFIKDKISSIYVRTGVSELTIYREILKELLNSLKINKLKVKKGFSIDVEFELKRLEYSIKATKQAQLGAKVFIIDGKTIKTTGESIEAHSEDTACLLIRDIIDNLTLPLIIFIDDLERLKAFVKEKSEYYRFISMLAINIDEMFNKRKVAFILSLDIDYFYAIKSNNDDSDNSVGFSFSTFIKLNNFPPGDFANIIKKRLNDSGWKKNLNDFITSGAFWILIYAVQGHPRKAFRILQMAIEFIENQKLPLQITEDCISEVLKSHDEEINKNDLKIIKFLSLHGSYSPSDEEFKKAININRSSLLKRLKSISEEKIILKIETKTIGNTQKDLYSLPDINLSI